MSIAIPLQSIQVDKHLENAELLHKLISISVKNNDLRSLLNEALSELLSVSWLALQPKGGIFLTDESGDNLRLIAAHNLSPQIELSCAKVAFGECLCGKAALAAQSQHASCIDHRHENRFDGMSPHGHYNVPIKMQDKVLGVLAVYLSPGHQYDEFELRFLESFCEALALLIELKQREIELVTAQATLHSALNDMNNLMRVVKNNTIFMQTKPDGTIVDVNEAFCKISGYSADELIGKEYSIVNSDTHTEEFWKEFWGTISAGKSWRGEICNKAKDGSLYWVDCIVAPLRGPDGRIEKYISIRFDITERKEAEEMLARFGRILDNSSNEIYVFDSQSLKFIQANQGAQDNLGYSMQELQKLTPIDLKPDMTKRDFEKYSKPLLNGEKDFVRFETIHQRKDGSLYPVEVNLHYANHEHPPAFVAIIQDATERKTAAAQIERLAYYDTLTGLPNRTLFQERFEHSLEKAKGADHSLALFFIDLDRFKEINDTKGHSVGDTVLEIIAKRLNHVIRDKDILARLGGDEFVIFTENEDTGTAEDILERIQNAFSKPLKIGNETHQISASVGVSIYPNDGLDSGSLLRNADIAMYQAKNSGANHCFYRDNMGANLQRQLDIAQRLATAINENLLELHYQPLVDLRSGHFIGSEALLRWQDNKYGRLSPAEFIPIAEDRRLACELGDWVFKTACKQLRNWRLEDKRFRGKMAINLSAQQLEEQGLVERFEAITHEFGIHPGALTLEITESAMMLDPDQAINILNQLKEVGFGLAIDDFGTDYSSLAYIKKFDIDKLKIDMSFVQSMLKDRNDFAIVKATIAMARELNISTLAEGIEHMSEAQTLYALGCQEGQGYLFGKPAPANKFAELYLKQQDNSALNDLKDVCSHNQ